LLTNIRRTVIIIFGIHICIRSIYIDIKGVVDMVYYVDPQGGDNSNDGRSEKTPLLSIDGRAFQSGDTVLFKRGTRITRTLRLYSGSEAGYITYGAYGSGPNPVVNTAIPANDPALWTESSPGVWRYLGALPSAPCNFIFDGGASFGQLCWSLSDLKDQGQWYFPPWGGETANRIVYNNTGGALLPDDGVDGDDWALYLASKKNPADFYQSVEIAQWGDRLAVTGKRYVVFRDFTVENIGVHGFWALCPDHIKIRDCVFRNIGGAIFDLPGRIRFGNGVEFWNGAEDCVVENCAFYDIYDSCVTHQGEPGVSLIPQRFIMRNNFFLRYGMAAYEWQGPCSKDNVFENNVCAGGCGSLGIQRYPDRVWRLKKANTLFGCHVVIYLLNQELPPGETYCTIRHNVFLDAPEGVSALVADIDDKYVCQFKIDHNIYRQTSGSLAIQCCGRTYHAAELDAFRSETGFDRNSVFPPG
jgi:hypothetical protein